MFHASLGARRFALGVFSGSVLCASISLRAVADFTGGQPLLSAPYSSAPNQFVPLNNNGQFNPPDPEMRFRPIAAIPVPGMPNTLAVARQFGGVDLLNATN